MTPYSGLLPFSLTASSSSLFAAGAEEGEAEDAGEDGGEDCRNQKQRCEDSSCAALDLRTHQAMSTSTPPPRALRLKVFSFLMMFRDQLRVPQREASLEGLTYMMNYLKERIEGMSEHTIEQDQEIGDLQTRTGNVRLHILLKPAHSRPMLGKYSEWGTHNLSAGEIVLDLMRLRKTEDDMVTVKTTIREHKDLISRNKNDLANSVARQVYRNSQSLSCLPVLCLFSASE